MWERLILGAVASRVSKFVNGRSIEAAHRLAGRASSAYTVRSIQMWKLRRTLQHVSRHSPFYRDLFRRHGVDVAGVSHPAELRDLYTSPQDFLDHSSEAFLCEAPRLIYETSGTTRRPKTLYYSHQEVEQATSRA